MFFRKILLVFSLISLICFSTALAQSSSASSPPNDEIFDTTEITVVEPSALQKEFNNLQRRSLSVANFGHVPWGRSLIGNAYYPTPNDGCTPLNPLDIHHDNDNVDSEDPDHPIIIVDRGNCAFDIKTQNAQQSGAKAVIIIDSVEGEDLNFLIPIGDKLGDRLTIPTILIDKHTGELFKKYLNQTPRVAVSLSISFELPKARNKTKIDVWLTSSDETGWNFIKSLEEMRGKLKDVIEFRPHPVLWYCRACQQVNYIGTDSDPNCVSSGRHCSPDPDGNGPLNGSEVLMEDLRQLCLFNHSQDAWWAYYNVFNSSCAISANLRQCSYDALKNIGVNTKTIDDCVNDSFSGGPPAKTENKIFAAESLEMQNALIRLWPTLLINKQMYRGNLFPADDIFEAVCDGFADIPRECLYEDTYSDKDGLIHYERRYYGLIIFAVVVIIGILFVTIFLCYKRRLKREVNEQMELMISQTMQRYVQLKD